MAFFNIPPGAQASSSLSRPVSGLPVFSHTPSIMATYPDGERSRPRPSVRVRPSTTRPRAQVVTAPPRSQTRRQMSMGVGRINKALQELHIPPASNVVRGTRLFVCEATEDEWNAFVECEAAAYRPSFTEWDSNGIYIIEFPGDAHEEYVTALNRLVHQNNMVDTYMKSQLAAYFSTGSKHMADTRFRPRRRLAEPRGAVLPQGITRWRDFATLVIEVGVSQGWNQMDRKVVNVWSLRPSIAYVLCVHIDEDFGNPQYKLWTLPLQRRNPPLIDIVAQATLVHLDAHRVLGLPPTAQLPGNFPNPIAIDVYAALVEAMDE